MKATALCLLGLLVLGAAMMVLASCSDNPSAPLRQEPLFETHAADQGALESTGAVSQFLAGYGEALNARLATENAEFRLGMAEWITEPDAVEGAGTYIYFLDRGNKQLGVHWVPGDPRRDGRMDITYAVDQTEGATSSGLTTEATTMAIDRAMDTWNNVNCSTIPITRLPDLAGVDLGVVEYLSGLGGLPFPVADITHTGWLPAGLLPDYVIGVTYTFWWVDQDGNPTDINGDHKFDAAFREILYNDIFDWKIDANMDVETIALHEAGHGLSQAHFGSAFLTTSNLKLHFNPRALMNAAYSGVQQEVTKTDNAGHCSIWASWPNK